MKKFALATVLALAATMASAVEVRVEGQDSDGKNGAVGSTNYELSVKEAINKNFAADVTTTQYRTDGTNTLANRFEAGVTASTGYTLGVPFTAYTRVAIGQKFVDNAGSFGYYSIEPGVAVPVASTGVTASLGYRFRDAFSDAQNDLTRTWRTKVGYDINANNNVYVGYDRQRGDNDQNITRVGYIHRF
jgi:hypothetical protein